MRLNLLRMMRRDPARVNPGNHLHLLDQLTDVDGRDLAVQRIPAITQLGIPEPFAGWIDGMELLNARADNVERRDDVGIDLAQSSRKLGPQNLERMSPREPRRLVCYAIGRRDRILQRKLEVLAQTERYGVDDSVEVVPFARTHGEDGGTPVPLHLTVGRI